MPQAPPLSDPHRPRYHFLPPANWMNDPNGLIQWQGAYHLFYQCNPNGPTWGTMHWGHASSVDLVDWTHHPIALTPTPGAADEDGCWSGCAVDDDGVPTVIYTGVRQGVQLPCLATSADDLTTWTTYGDNPLIAAPPDGLDLIGFRDHMIWREHGMWYQGIGSGLRDVGGAVLLYRSPDLRHWEYVHPLCVGDALRTEPLWTGSMWECPSFFALGDKHVLIVSIWHAERLHYAVAMIGTYAAQRFTPEQITKLDFGDRYFYAPQTMQDDRGRRLMWGWIQEGRSEAAQRAAGWSGVMSLPRQITWRNGGIEVAPVAELKALRESCWQQQHLAIADGAEIVLAIAGDTLEIIAEFDAGDAAEIGLIVRRSPHGDEATTIMFDRASRRLTIDRRRSSSDADTDRTIHVGNVAVTSDEAIQFHMFLDRSVIEVFVNERACITTRVYPMRIDSIGLAVVARGGRAMLSSIAVWQLRSIWPPTESL